MLLLSSKHIINQWLTIIIESTLCSWMNEWQWHLASSLGPREEGGNIIRHHDINSIVLCLFLFVCSFFYFEQAPLFSELGCFEKGGATFLETFRRLIDHHGSITFCRFVSCPSSSSSPAAAAAGSGRMMIWGDDDDDDDVIWRVDNDDMRWWWW